MRRLLLLLFATLPLCFISCSEMGSPPASVADEAPAAEPAFHDTGAPSPPPAPPQQQTELDKAVVDARQIIRTATLGLTVEDTEAAAAQVKSVAEGLGGYVATLNAQRRDTLLGYEISVYVPGERFDAALEQLKALADTVESEQIMTEDVTDQLVDLGARLKTLNTTEEELRALLDESQSRQQKVEDIMKVYHELTGIRTDIERLRAHEESLRQRVAMSRISIRLNPVPAAVPIVQEVWRPWNTVRSSTRALVALFQFIVDALIVLVIMGVPVALLAGVILWAAYRIARKVQAAQKAPGAPGTSQTP